ncbi:BspA family leucine-rich repeat surface protein [Fulvivirga sp. M361]|uniref:BspA family leucine-rich repeat surface protein n=1 Tax=Fulvivirga sp. M361 TaxID=2594266 RepID=UPI00117AC405|nr:BspA family leucine-rich repeat surface protein [Fulvivirga sp. M361]TRX49048.1 BspA family leucine-rich repeat surface protein [Fulvivirga sp. M361]
MQKSFARCSNLEVTATDAPDLSQVIFMTEMFSDATSFNGDIGDWDIGNVKSLSGMFSGDTAFQSR